MLVTFYLYPQIVTLYKIAWVIIYGSVKEMQRKTFDVINAKINKNFFHIYCNFQYLVYC